LRKENSRKKKGKKEITMQWALNINQIENSLKMGKWHCDAWQMNGRMDRLITKHEREKGEREVKKRGQRESEMQEGRDKLLLQRS